MKTGSVHTSNLKEAKGPKILSQRPNTKAMNLMQLSWVPVSDTTFKDIYLV
jgi:hypothetical protein